MAHARIVSGVIETDGFWSVEDLIDKYVDNRPHWTDVLIRTTAMISRGVDRDGMGDGSVDGPDLVCRWITNRPIRY